MSDKPILRRGEDLWKEIFDNFIQTQAVADDLEQCAVCSESKVGQSSVAEHEAPRPGDHCGFQPRY